MKPVRWFVYLLAFAVLVLHQDWWNFHTATPLVFGFLPIGLAYHAAYSLACCVLMALLVAVAWPKELEKYEALPQSPATTDGH